MERATQPVPTFYDVQDVADMFQMSRMTVYRAIQHKELPAVRIRGRWLVPARVIEALIVKAEAAVPEPQTNEWMADDNPFRRSQRSKEG